VIAASIVAFGQMRVSQTGLALAIASGAIASGCGYVVWYAALRGLAGTRAAVVQLAVPVLAAMAGVAVLGEQVTLRLVIASVATLGGVAMVLAQRAAKPA
jgi:drug/metabolite transporter (DMT)-like permease